MQSHHRIIGAIVPAALCLGTSVALAERRPPVDLGVALRVRAVVPAGVLRETKIEVERTFLAAGVRVVWVEHRAPPFHRPHVTLIVDRAEAQARRGADATGELILGSASPPHHTAHVFHDRVAALVADRQVPVSVVLAHVVAHELGHLLLLPDSHEAYGVMRRDVPLEHPALRRFTPEQSRQLRATLASWPYDPAPDGPSSTQLWRDPE